MSLVLFWRSQRRVLAARKRQLSRYAKRDACAHDSRSARFSFWWGVTQRFSLRSGARCRNPHNDHHHFRAGVAVCWWPRTRLPLRCHSNPARELRRYCCGGGVRKRRTELFRGAAELGRNRAWRTSSKPSPSRFMFTTWLKITSHSIAVIEVLLAIVISHVFFFA